MQLHQDECARRISTDFGTPPEGEGGRPNTMRIDRRIQCLWATELFDGQSILVPIQSKSQRNKLFRP